MKSLIKKLNQIIRKPRANKEWTIEQLEALELSVIVELESRLNLY